MNSLFRHSKFKHTHGIPAKREECYENIRVTKSSWDSTFCDVNEKYLAIITESAGGGSFCVVNLERMGRIDPKDMPMVLGHKSAVLDIKWCPHNPDVIASASEDSTVKIWMIPLGGISGESPLVEPIVDLVLHQRRVGLILWHPSVENILVSSGQDNLVVVWNVSTSEALTQIEFPDFINSLAFNWEGSKLITCCRDKKLRIVDAKNGTVLSEGTGHEGAKPQQCIYTKNDSILTTGFSRMSHRELCIWRTDDLSNPLTNIDLDASNSTLFIHYDADINMFYISAKGDCFIRFYEITPEEPYIYALSQYTSQTPQRGIGWMPKRALNLSTNEIARGYRIQQNGFVEPISFVVPRKSDLFQEDLYPDTVSGAFALTAEEWFGEASLNKAPPLVALRDIYQATNGTANLDVKKPKIVVNMRPVAPTIKTNSDNTASSLSSMPQKQEISNKNDKLSDFAHYVLKEDYDKLKDRVEHLELELQKVMAMLAATTTNNNNSIEVLDTSEI